MEHWIQNRGVVRVKQALQRSITEYERARDIRQRQSFFSEDLHELHRVGTRKMNIQLKNPC